MGIQTIARDLTPLNHYLTEVPDKKAFQFKCKAFALSTLEKICWVAFVAIVVAIFAVSYSGIALTGGVSILMAGLAIASPLLGMGASQLTYRAREYTKMAQMESGVAEEYRAIAHWRQPEIEQFYRQHGLRIERVLLDPLRQLNATEPLTALLPLIARFQYLHKVEMEMERDVQEKLTHQIEREIQQTEAQRGVPLDASHKRVIRLSNRQIAWKKHEHEAIPRGLDAALVLQILQLPNLNLSLTDIGEFRAKTFEERQFDRLYAPANDDYFVFHSDLHRIPLTLAEIEQDLSPRTLRLKLFPREAVG